MLGIYMLWPSPIYNIEDFAQVPNSVRSQLDGDIWQVPNLKSFFSNEYREDVVSMYGNDYKNSSGFWFYPFILNYPPENAYKYIKDQTQSTYLVELYYPLRESLFINGMEPLDESTKEPRYTGAVPFNVDGTIYETKVTIRYYPSPFFVRLATWFGISISLILLLNISKRVLYKK